jgi:hypothetical protein
MLKQLQVSGQFHAPSSFFRDKRPGYTLWGGGGGWVVSMSLLGCMGK